jgi:hypothetical protein
MTMAPADKDSTAIESVSNLPEMIRDIPGSNRIGPRGQKYLRMTRTRKGPNRLIVQVKNLKPESTYSLKLYTLDLDAPAVKPDSPHGISVKVHGGELLTGESSSRTDEDKLSRVVRGTRRPEDIYFTHHFYVFRVDGNTAEIELSDWVDGKPGGTVGQKLYYDFFQVQPYYMGSNE